MFKNKFFYLLLIFLINFKSIVIYAEDDFEYAPFKVNLSTINKSFDINFLYKDYELYAPLVELFDTFKIENTFLENEKKMVGFYPFSENKYTINFNSLKYDILNKQGIISENDFLYNNDILYLKVEVLSRLFKLDLLVNFSDLRIDVKNDENLPIVKNSLLVNKKNKKKKKLKENHFDYFVKEPRTFLRGGKLSFATSYLYQVKDNESFDSERHSLTFGFEFLKGDFILHTNGNDKEVFNLEQTNFLFNYIFPEFKYFKLFQLGNISNNNAFSRNLLGIYVSNEYQFYEDEFNNLIINKYTYSNAIIEVYNNGINIINTKSDSTGLYKLKIPIYYGKNHIEIKIYGEHGEEKHISFLYNIQNKLLKDKTFLFNIALGQDINNNKSYSSVIKYGINSNISIYNSCIYEIKERTVNTKKYDEFFNKTDIYFNFFKNYNYSISYNTSNQYLKNSLNYLSKYFYLSSSYSNSLNQLDKYEYVDVHWSSNFGKNRYNINYKNTFDEYEALSFFIPVRINPAVFKFNFEYYNNFYKSNNLKFDFYFFYNFYYIPYLSFLEHLNFSFRSKYSFIEDLESINLSFDKTFLYNLKFNYTYNKNFISDISTNSIKINKQNTFLNFYSEFKYINKNNMSISIGINSTIAYNSTINKIFFYNWDSLGKGSITLIPFNDLNMNKKFDGNDRLMKESLIFINGNNKIKNDIANLFLSDKNHIYKKNFVSALSFSDGFHNYKPLYKKIGYIPRPNLFTTIYYPFVEVKELSVNLFKNNEHNPIKGIHLSFLNLTTNEKTEGFSDLDGEIYLYNLMPGKYLVSFDKQQLEYLSLEPKNKKYEFLLTLNEDKSLNILLKKKGKL